MLSRAVLPSHRQTPQNWEKRGKNVIALAAAGETEVKEVALASSAQEDAGDWIPVCLPEELPKGVRKEVEVDGRQVLLFWYRSQIFCIEARSPAEGAYSEGFIRAKFTQDFCIECPSTGSLFSLKDGSIVSWYPNNPVLRALTPKDTCRPLEIFPVKVTQKAVCIDLSAARFAHSARNRGGAGSSIENNNVFSVGPTVYFEGMDPTKEAASLRQSGPVTEGINPAVAVTTTVAVGAVAVAGTAVAVWQENLALLAALWIGLGGAAAYAGYQYVNKSSAGK